MKRFAIVGRSNSCRATGSGSFWGTPMCATWRRSPSIFQRPYNYVDHVLIGADPPAHTAAREIIARLFAPSTLSSLESEAATLAPRLLSSEFDIVGDYAVPFSRAIASRLLGIDDDVLKAIARAEKAAQDSVQPLNALISSIDALADRFAVFHALKEAEGSLFSRDELVSLVRFLWLAATTTTERALACAGMTLLGDPSLLESLRGPAASTGRFVEEILRLYPPEQMLPRIATRPVELGGARIPAGAKVMLCIAAANRDPEVFADPGALRLDRPANPHLSFGSGIHHCSGTGLARRMLPIGITGLIEAPNLRVVQPLDTALWHRTITAIRPLSLVIGT